ncbi:patatin-like phospholipase family protein [Amycolatopsis sp. NPDC049868]|uniref:patatin-like phospholipase family protein n=1 Tax=Amycolatopsis sp. NPDC049868 TaxID=3363934 RepID=UPI0037A6ABF8
MNNRKALVLGGGGLTGGGWLIGMLCGLADAGVDLCESDLIVGTSSGALVGAQVATGCDLEVLYDQTVFAAHPEPALELSSTALATLGGLLGGAQNPQLCRARVGHAAMEAKSASSHLREFIGARLPDSEWPERRLRLTAVEALSGEFAVFDSESGLSLLDAVVASCALPFVYPPARALGRRWIDGFTRSPANADVAEAYGRIVVLAPMPEGFAANSRVVDQTAELASRTGALIATVVADSVPVRPLDPALLPEAAVAGRAQAAAVVDEIAVVWNVPSKASAPAGPAVR